MALRRAFVWGIVAVVVTRTPVATRAALSAAYHGEDWLHGGILAHMSNVSAHHVQLHQAKRPTTDPSEAQVITRHTTRNTPIKRQQEQISTNEGQMTTITADGSSTPKDSICRAVEDSFQGPVVCNCWGTVTDFFTISCEYSAAICSSSSSSNSSSAASSAAAVKSASTVAASSKNSVTGGLEQACGRPIVAVTLVQGQVFSSTACIYNYQVGSRSLSDTCTTAQVCDQRESGFFCDCTASYGGRVCSQCSVCGDLGHGLAMDCTNVDVNAISRSCTEIDVDLNLVEGAGQVAAFVPQMDQFCSTLSEGIMSCNCSAATTDGSFNVTCASQEIYCPGSQCAQSQSSTVVIEQGQATWMESCVDYFEPFGRTCTTLYPCSGANLLPPSNETASSVCSCSASYKGQSCTACSICEDGSSLKLDCSNVYSFAVVDTCQPFTASSSYEFFPSYKQVPVTTSASTLSTPSALLSIGLAIAAHVVSFRTTY